MNPKRHNTIDETAPKYNYRSRNLPHVFDPSLAIFITYRLAFELTEDLIMIYNERRQNWLTTQTGKRSSDLLETEYRAASFNIFDELIATSDKLPRLLETPSVQNMLHESLLYHNEIRYHLIAYCIMPNHVHVVIQPKQLANGEIFPISRITYTWKRYSANRINSMLQKTGIVWQQESYDHSIKNYQGLKQVIEYVVNNPVKAGFVPSWEQWEGTWISSEYGDKTLPGV